MKLELKHIANYLPYGLKMIFEKSGRIIELSGLQIEDSGNLIFACGDQFYESTIWNFKPLLLPLSALTEQLPDGSVPIVELAKILYPEVDCKSAYKLEKDGVIIYRIDNGSTYVIDYFNFDDGGFYIYTDNYKFSHDYVTSSKNIVQINFNYSNIFSQFMPTFTALLMPD